MLLAGIAPSFVSSLPLESTEQGQLLVDLTAMNRSVRLLDGTTPLIDWLKNAIQSAAERPETEVFRRALASVTGHAAPHDAGANKCDRERSGHDDKNRRANVKCETRRGCKSVHAVCATPFFRSRLLLSLRRAPAVTATT